MLVGGGLATRARVMLVEAADLTSCQHFPYQGGSNDEAESSWHRCDSAVHRLSRRRAPVLEQNSCFRALTGIAFMVLLGAAAFWGVRTLPGQSGLAALGGSPHGVSDLSYVYSGRFME